MRYIQGEDRDQSILFPESLDDYVDDNNPVRFIDAFVDSLDNKNITFTHSETKSTGRKPYNPSDMLKLYLFGYLNKIRSSRRLEKATHSNIELIWLMRKLTPDFKTISDFRKDNSKAIQKVCKEFTLLCSRMGLFGSELVAVDGSKFSAVNSKQRNYTKKKLQKMMKRSEQKINEYLAALEANDREQTSTMELSKTELEEKISFLKQQMARYNELESDMEASGEKQISQTDPESRKMRTAHGWDVSYNGQVAVDDKNKLVVDFDLTNEENDLNQLHKMATKAKETLDADKLKVVADAGYFKKEEIKKCERDNIECYVPEPAKGHNRSKGLYTNKDFSYDSKNDIYRCPSGCELNHRSTIIRKDQRYRIYKTKQCQQCLIKNKCTSSKEGRRIFRWESEKIIEEMNDRSKKNPEIIKKRKAIVEHPFGTLKRSMNQGYFLTKGLENTKTEFSLSILAYNMKRVLNIVDFKQLMAIMAMKNAIFSWVSDYKLDLKGIYQNNKAILSRFLSNTQFSLIPKNIECEMF